MSKLLDASRERMRSVLMRHLSNHASMEAIANACYEFFPDVDRPRVAYEDSELMDWLLNARQSGGGFVNAIAEAGLRADLENYPILRPVLLQLKERYPAYSVPRHG